MASTIEGIKDMSSLKSNGQKCAMILEGKVRQRVRLIERTSER